MNFEIWGLSGTLATERSSQMSDAEERLWHWVGMFDDACNRFKPNSEISRLNAAAGQATRASATLELALDAALRAFDATGGLCDPTILPALLALGYDRDYDELARDGATDPRPPVPSPGVTAIEFDRKRHTVTLAPGCALDLGAIAKALVCDLVANDVAASGGVIVEIGGDVAVRGAGPDGPWAIAVSDSLLLSGDEPRITLHTGGVATSSRTTRTWTLGNDVANHIIDPRTGSFAHGEYATASVTASDCVIANAFATAALLWDNDAAHYVAQAGWSARLVRSDGTVEFVGGWPDEGETTS